MEEFTMMTTKEVAEFHGVTTTCVLQWITSGELPAIRRDWMWFVRREDCTNFQRPPLGRPKTKENSNG